MGSIQSTGRLTFTALNVLVSNGATKHFTNSECEVLHAQTISMLTHGNKHIEDIVEMSRRYVVSRRFEDLKMSYLQAPFYVQKDRNGLPVIGSTGSS